MKEQLISFETAKLASEKGFDESVEDYHAIYEDGEQSIVHRYHRNSIDRSLFGQEAYSAPSQSLMQKWMREKHKIYVYCERHTTHLSGWHVFVEPLEFGKRIPSIKDWVHHHYEECLEWGLQEALKLIKE